MASGNTPAAAAPRSGRVVVVAFCAAAAALLAAVDGARADNVDLAFNSLPSAQGWVYSFGGNAAPEGSVFSVDGTALHQNTIGVGFNPAGGGNLYTLANVVDPAQPYSLTMRARVPQAEQDPSNTTIKFGFFFEASDGARRFAIALTPTQIQDLNFATLSTGIDNTVFHDYRLEVPTIGPALLFVDGNFVANTAPRSANFSRLALGDGTGASNAAADVTLLQLRQVPEPAAGMLLAAAGGGLLLARRRRPA